MTGGSGADASPARPQPGRFMQYGGSHLPSQLAPVPAARTFPLHSVAVQLSSTAWHGSAVHSEASLLPVLCLRPGWPLCVYLLRYDDSFEMDRYQLAVKREREVRAQGRSQRRSAGWCQLAGEDRATWGAGQGRDLSQRQALSAVEAALHGRPPGGEESRHSASGAGAVLNGLPIRRVSLACAPQRALLVWLFLKPPSVPERTPPGVQLGWPTARRAPRRCLSPSSATRRS